MGKRSTYLVPFHAATGGLLHYVPDDPPLKPGRTRSLWHNVGEIDWREPKPFEPKGPVEVLDSVRGRSAANTRLAGPPVRVEVACGVMGEDRPTYYLTQDGLIALIRGGAFDGPRLRKGVKLVPVKRGANYNVELYVPEDSK